MQLRFCFHVAVNLLKHMKFINLIAVLKKILFLDILITLNFYGSCCFVFELLQIFEKYFKVHSGTKDLLDIYVYVYMWIYMYVGTWYICVYICVCTHIHVCI